MHWWRCRHTVNGGGRDNLVVKTKIGLFNRPSIAGRLTRGHLKRCLKEREREERERREREREREREKKERERERESSQSHLDVVYSPLPGLLPWVERVASSEAPVSLLPKLSPVQADVGLEVGEAGGGVGQERADVHVLHELINLGCLEDVISIEEESPNRNKKKLPIPMCFY